VPTGNFGDILAGYIASKMGLNIDMLNIATNENDILTRTLTTGIHDLKKVKQTSSPSIDIQISSNFERLLYDITQDHSYVIALMKELKNNNSYVIKSEILEKIKNSFCSYSVSQEEVISTIDKLYERSNIVIDPHTAVGLASSRKCPSNYDLYITLSTAHPAKFKDTVSSIVKNESYIPAKINNILNLDEEMIVLENDMLSVKNFITKNI
jgi:threonine synthase